MMQQWKWLPWVWLGDKINQKFLEEYDSSKPIGLTAQRHVEKQKMAKKNHPFLYKLEKILFSIECFVEHKIIDIVRFPSIYLSNIKNKTHYIPTGLQRGKWHDTTSKFENGFYHMIKFYVDVEAKRSFDYYDKLKKENNQSEIDEYPTQQKELMDLCLDFLVWREKYFVVCEIMIEKLYGLVERHEDEDEFVMATFIHNKNNTLIYNDIHLLEKYIDDRQIYFMVEITKRYKGLWS